MQTRNKGRHLWQHTFISTFIGSMWSFKDISYPSSFIPFQHFLGLSSHHSIHELLHWPPKLTSMHKLLPLSNLFSSLQPDSFFKTQFNYIILFFLKVFQWLSNTFKSQRSYGTSLVVQWQRLHAPNEGNLHSIPGQRTRSHMLQLKICMLQLRPSAAK